MSDDVAIEIKDVKKSFKIHAYSRAKFAVLRSTQCVLKGVNLTVRKGEVMGILGANGSGKSTLLKMISGITFPDEGTVKVNGNVASILELNMGFHDDLTGSENIYIRGKMYGISQKVIKERYDSIVEMADIGNYIDYPVKTYSSGMKSRLAFAIMVNVDADIYIIDEALSVGDSLFNNKVASYFKSIIGEKKTIVLTSHSTYAVKRMCSRVAVIEDGVIKHEGNTDEICDMYNSPSMASPESVKRLSDAGYPAAQLTMARYFRDGIVVEKNDEAYRELLRISASAGYGDAAIEYADMLTSEGKNEEAAEFLRVSAIAGDKSSMWRYANLFKRFDEDALHENMRTLSETGNHFDKYRYALYLLETSACRNDVENAYRIFCKSAEEGNSAAKYNIAVMKLKGHGTAIDIQNGMEMLTKLEKDGYIPAIEELADIYRTGKYVPCDSAKYRECIEKLAVMGIPKYQFKIAMMYQNGDSVDKNDDKATYWFGRYTASSLCDNLYRSARSTLDSDHVIPTDTADIYRTLIDNNHRAAVTEYGHRLIDSNRVKDKKEFFDMCRKAAVSQGPEQGLLAMCYFKGIGVEPDLKEAFRLFRLAADYGDPHSMMMAAIMYKNGIGVEKSDEMYTRYVLMAAKSRNHAAMEMVKKWKSSDLKRIKRISKPCIVRNNEKKKSDTEGAE